MTAVSFRLSKDQLKNYLAVQLKKNHIKLLIIITDVMLRR